MASAITSKSAPKLSICISTRNRATFLRETLDSIIAQATDDCEIVVLDGASTDSTAQVVSDSASRFPNFRYLRQEVNNGLDRGFNEAVELAQGEYCWLMPDDDLLKPGAIATIIPLLYREYSLIVVNVEYRSFDMSKVVEHCDLDVASNMEFAPSDLDGLFAASWKLVRYIGSVVIKREIWIAREKEKYFDSYWMEVCVIFQERLPAASLLLSEKLISVRMENQSWLSKWFEVFCVSWPRLVRNFPISAEVQEQACSEEPWESLGFLVMARAAGQYSLGEYRHHIRPRLRTHRRRAIALGIAILPGVILNTCLMFRYSLIRSNRNGTALSLLTNSRFCLRRWRAT
jgi:abequosyltransferase